jgi:predicted Zn-dependent protease
MQVPKIIIRMAVGLVSALGLGGVLRSEMIVHADVSQYEVLTSGVPDEYQGAISAAEQEWIAATQRPDLFIGNPSSDTQARVIQIFWHQSGISKDENGKNELGTTTQYEESSDTIADIDLYQTTIANAYKNHGFSSMADVVQVAMVHELGHALGLQHVEDTSDVMYPALQTKSQKISVSDLTHLNTSVSSAAIAKAGEKPEWRLVSAVPSSGILDGLKLFMTVAVIVFLSTLVGLVLAKAIGEEVLPRTMHRQRIQ